MRHLLFLIVDAKGRQGMFLVTDAVEHCGSFLGSLLVTQCYKLGLHWGDSWRGIPFLVMSFFFLAAFIIVVVWDKKYGHDSGQSEQDATSPI